MSYRRIDTDLWLDRKWRNDMADTHLRYLWLYLLTSPKATTCGIYPITFEEIALHTRMSLDAVKMYLMRLNELHLIIYSRETEEIAILNYPKYNIYSWGKPMEDAIKGELSRVQCNALIKAICLSLKGFCENRPNDKRTSLLTRVYDLYRSFLLGENKEIGDIGVVDNNGVSSTNKGLLKTNKLNNLSLNDTIHDTIDDKSWDDLINELDNGENDNDI